MRLKSPFGISRGVRVTVENVFINLDGHWGEAVPVAYHGHTTELLQTSGEAICVPESFAVRPEEAIQQISKQIGGFRPVLAAMDMAIHDAWAANQGKTLLQMWGLAEKNAPPSSFTIGLGKPEEMAEKVESAPDFPILKVKLGAPNDLERLTAIRNATGKRIRVDANEGWDRESANWWIEQLADWDVELVEQPLPRDDHEGLRDLFKRNKGRVPIILDESVQTGSDVAQALGIADGINIKLAKCGGLLEARKMISSARNLGLLVMVGCMVESSLGISAAAHIAPLADFVDLDGAALLADDPFDGVRFEQGYARFSNRPGLGAVLREEAGSG
ncbi:MAG: dipeptide epimerase [bacterium]